jgi:hypothetical protein
MRTVVSALLLSMALLGCAGTAASPAPSASPSESPSESPGAGAAGVLAGVPTGCYGIGIDDCQRVVGTVAAALDASTAPLRYVQVGPFGCLAGERCPTTLAARPEGDVTLETADGAFAYHVVAGGGGTTLDITRQDAFLVDVEPTSTPPVTLGPQPFALGHCGLGSGIDVGGSWWDPVGPIDSDHPDAINSAEGTINVLEPDRAVYTTRGGLTVQLVRRDGSKGLPPCM